jgi:two-component system nitrate/nitrite response regulator NarL
LVLLAPGAVSPQNRLPAASFEPSTFARAHTIRIVIADRQPIFRHGLRRLLETDPRLVIVSETHDGATAAAAIRELRPDILLLGLNAPGCRPADMLHEAAANGEVRTIILADRLSAPEVAGALQLGACGVLPKDSAPDELFNSIHAVMAGHMWVGRGPTSNMSASLKKLKAARRQTNAFGLTQREIEIVKAVMAGCSSTKGIAERSAISENTVKSHLTHIFNKMGVSNRVELVQFAAHHRLLDLI